ncbi:hypothetical protein [Pseudomonas fluorescens]|uniref:hypothetical protein n=1 Tax=Pseudomonas fluorescens TaxID=294 RepID=UPI0010E2997B|nr:hypothetical protein [Pseudomonas fluorescens]TCV62697.1 hypothetical protein EDB98_1125 [Pseudomonas fluorescens]
MTQAQKQALEILSAAFNAAKDCGALDVLNNFQRDPDSINDVVESLSEALTA